MSNAGWDNARAWKGATDTWQREVGRVLGGEAKILQGIVSVRPPAGENRLTLRANTRGERAVLIAAIRRSKSYLKISAQLTPFEKTNRSMLYKFAHERNLRILDNGDECYLQHKGAEAWVSPRVELHRPAGEVRQQLMVAGKRLAMHREGPHR